MTSEATRARARSRGLAAFAELGIADVGFFDGVYVLLDETRREVGRISSSADAIVDTQLRGNRVRTASTLDAMSIECNGLGVSLGSDAGSLDDSQLAVLAPCRDALRAADLVITGNVPPASGTDDPALVDCSPTSQIFLIWAASRRPQFPIPAAVRAAL